MIGDTVETLLSVSESETNRYSQKKTDSKMELNDWRHSGGDPPVRV